MSVLSYYARHTTTQQWEHTLHHDYSQYHLPYYAELQIINFTQDSWTSAPDVLKYLLTQPTKRRLLLECIAAARPTQLAIIYLTHPLLKLPLYLTRQADDEGFCREIQKYLKLEGIYKWTA